MEITSARMATMVSSSGMVKPVGRCESARVDGAAHRDGDAQCNMDAPPNGANPPPTIPLPGVDLLYVQLEPASGNCFEKNKPKDALTFLSTQPDGQLPTDGC